MPTPLIHASVAGACAHIAGQPQLDRRAFWLCLFAANMADLDVIPGLFLGNMMLYHHQLTHSPVFALTIALMISAIPWEPAGAPGPRTSWSKRLAFLSAAAITHPFLDLLTYDHFNTFKGGPNGIPLGWPFSPRRWDSYQVFEGLRLNGLWSDWISLDNLKIYAVEGALGGALIAAGRLYSLRGGLPIDRSSSQAEPVTHG